MAAEGGPWDQCAAGKSSEYSLMATAAGLEMVARYANAIGVQKSMVMREAGGELVHVAADLREGRRGLGGRRGPARAACNHERDDQDCDRNANAHPLGWSGLRPLLTGLA
mgnify:CR=1 FL=1